MDKYDSYADLRASERPEVDFTVQVLQRQDPKVAIIAPHGGGIEPGTAELAVQIAGEQFSLYCFKGIKKSGNRNLHITSQNFDEPQCLDLIKKHERVVAIHGCDTKGERVLLGGRDQELIAELAEAVRSIGIGAETSGHKYLGLSATNICNRGATNSGVQFELSMAFRRSSKTADFVAVVRDVLLRDH